MRKDLTMDPSALYSLDIKYHRGAGLLFVLLIVVEQDFLAADHNILPDSKDNKIKKCGLQRLRL